jgi:pimeloyl-ACP methyl ester carboxylesterase
MAYANWQTRSPGTFLLGGFMKLFIKNIELNFTKIGVGKPLIMLHGNSEDLSIFNELSDSLKEKYQIYLIDLRNHGKSTLTDDFSYDIMAYDIYQFVNKLKLDKPHFFGFSDGAIIGMLLSISYPDLFDHLTLAGGNLSPKGVKKKAFLKMNAYFEKTKSPYYEMMINQPNILSKDLKKIQNKTLILAGEHDLIKDSHTQMIHRNIKNSKLLILPNKRHEDYIINTDFLKDILIDFYQ